MSPEQIAAVGQRPVVGFKAAPEDFLVFEEQGAVAPEETGADAAQRAFLIEKRGLDTPALVRLLARWAQVPEVEIGYAGRKDRQAVTTQWLTVPAPAVAKAGRPLAQQIASWREDGSLPQGGALRLLAARGQRRKLRVGELACNRFLIRLRAVAATGPDELAHALAALRLQAGHGIPNAFGPQRFGQYGLADARRWAEERSAAAGRGRQRRRRRSAAEGWHLSVLRAHLFNLVLAERVRQAPAGALLPGDELVDGVPTGPLWGRGRSAVSASALELERSALASEQALCDVLEHAGPSLDRRALWMRPRDLVAHRSGGDLWLGFRLPRGSYATALLEPFFDLQQPGRAVAGAARAA